MPFLLLALLLALAPALAQDTPTNPPRGDFRAVVLSDFNGPYGALRYPPPLAPVLEAVIRVWQPDLVLSAGDVVAGQSAALPESRFAEMWAVFEREVAAPLRAAGIPFAVTVGNHDGSSLRRPGGSFAFGRERDAARAYWTSQPPALEVLERADFPFHYSFALGSVFVAAWDASSAAILPEQLDWLAAQLSSEAARSARYRILLGHLPLYGVGQGKTAPGEVLTNGDALRQRLESMGLDLYVSGHHAAYYPGKVGALTLLHSGGIGARPLLGDPRPGRSAVTVLDLWLEPLTVRFTTYDVADLSEIRLEDLPAFIDGLNGRITRLDLAP